jgi:hypothetical protein
MNCLDRFIVNTSLSLTLIISPVGSYNDYGIGTSLRKRTLVLDAFKAYLKPEVRSVIHAVNTVDHVVIYGVMNLQLQVLD